jgi:RND family efflux transporter MFP subunit
MPIVKLSQEDLFRLVIPVPETYVRYIKIGDPVNVRVPALNRTFPGVVARFSAEVASATRTMHTEVDVPNARGVLIPGVYAEATLALDRKGAALVAPLQGINRAGEQAKALVVNSANRIEERDVTLGIETDSEAEILSGLVEGERVVIGDSGGLRPGEPVHPQVTQAAAYKGQN